MKGIGHTVFVVAGMGLVFFLAEHVNTAWTFVFLFALKKGKMP